MFPCLFLVLQALFLHLETSNVITVIAIPFFLSWATPHRALLLSPILPVDPPLKACMSVNSQASLPVKTHCVWANSLRVLVKALFKKFLLLLFENGSCCVAGVELGITPASFSLSDHSSFVTSSSDSFLLPSSSSSTVKDSWDYLSPPGYSKIIYRF